MLGTKESSSKPDRGIVSVETKGINQRGEEVCYFRRKVMVWKRDFAAAPRPALRRVDLVRARGLTDQPSIRESGISDPVDPARFASEDPAAINQAAAVGFERGAGDYEQARPSYPAAAVELVVDVLGLGPGRRVLDLAAGTGKFTRLLVPSGAELVAVEPVAAMRDELGGLVPGVEVARRTAEDLPLGDASVDAVVVGPGVPLVRRRPRAAPRSTACCGPAAGSRWCGTCATSRSTGCASSASSSLAAAGSVQALRHGTDWPWTAVAGRRSAFTELRHAARSPTTSRSTSTTLLVARAASTSFVSALPDDERSALLAEVRQLVETHPDLAGRERFAFPYVTDVSWCERV